MSNGKALLIITRDWHLYRWTARDCKRSLMFNNASKAVWMSDNKGILFITDKPGLYLARAPGESPTIFQKATTNMYSPVWSPDGTQLAYLEGVETDRHVTWNVNLLHIRSGKIQILKG